MSYALYLWKPRKGSQRSPGSTFLRLGETPCPELDPFPENVVGSAMDAAFPGWRTGADAPWAFEHDMEKDHLAVNLPLSVASELKPWFVSLAEKEALVLFDPQIDEVTVADQAEADAEFAKKKAELYVEEQADLAAEFPALLARAEAGDATAQCLVGQRYSFGDGVPADPAKAVHWYERSAQTGNTDAMLNLAALCRQGRGVPRDVGKAIAFLESAVMSDPMCASYELGEIYASGDGVPKDRDKAETLYRVALAQGHPEARRALRLLGDPVEPSTDPGSKK